MTKKKSKKQFGYAKPVMLANNLWEIKGEWSNAFGRRMTIVRLQTIDQKNALVIHNAIQLEEAELDWLKSLGEVKCIVAPNAFHCSDAGWMSQQFPQALLLVPKSKLAAFKLSGFGAKDTVVSFPAELQNDLKMIPMQGTKVEEVAFVHVPSKTLILCDLAFNMPPVFKGLTKLLMSWNKVGVRFGPTRITKLIFTTDKKLLVASYARLLNEDFDRVIVNHGDVLESGGKEKLRFAVEEIFGIN
jgi:hypothetical protein